MIEVMMQGIESFCEDGIEDWEFKFLRRENRELRISGKQPPPRRPVNICPEIQISNILPDRQELATIQLKMAHSRYDT